MLFFRVGDHTKEDIENNNWKIVQNWVGLSLLLTNNLFFPTI